MSKTIAFIWINPLDASQGGIERVTRRLMDGLSDRGYRCLYIMHHTESGIFEHEKKEINDLSGFLESKNIDAIVNQNGYSSQITNLIADSGWSGNYVVCHHNEPFYLAKLYDFRRVVSEVLVSGVRPRTRFSWMLRLVTYPLWRVWSTRQVALTQMVNYEYCSRYVVLCPAFIEQFSHLVGRKNLSKAVSIPNPLSFAIDDDQATLLRKDLTVLIVARMNDREKRISSALKAWKKIEASGQMDWILKIVGDGPDLSALQDMAEKMGLRNVVFLGRQDPIPHYRAASIFMMTSKVEGWGMTVTEAMQMGVVPVAFDSYASLQEIIEHGFSGILVKNGDITEFSNEIRKLMTDAEMRKKMAINAFESSHRFSLDNVLDKWGLIL